MPRRTRRASPTRSRPALGWEDLRLLLCVARRGRLADAAQDLGIDGSNVGRRLSSLDQRLGARLFERGPTGLTATPLARALLADAEAMESAALAAERKLVAAAEPVSGIVSVAVTESFAMYFLFAELEAVLADLPGVELRLVVSHGLANLARREADIALRFVRPEQQDLYLRRLATLRFSLYGSATYLAGRPRADPEQGLAGHRLLRWGGPPIRPATQAWLDAHSRAAEPGLILTQMHLLIEASARGLGLAALPGAMAIGQGGLERAIDHAIDETDLWLVVHRDLHRVPRIRAVADALARRIDGARERLRAI